MKDNLCAVLDEASWVEMEKVNWLKNIYFNLIKKSNQIFFYTIIRINNIMVNNFEVP